MKLPHDLLTLTRDGWSIDNNEYRNIISSIKQYEEFDKIFDKMFMRQKRNEMALLIWTTPHGLSIHGLKVQTAAALG